MRWQSEQSLPRQGDEDYCECARSGPAAMWNAASSGAGRGGSDRAQGSGSPARQGVDRRGQPGARRARHRLWRRARGRPRRSRVIKSSAPSCSTTCTETPFVLSVRSARRTLRTRTRPRGTSEAAASCASASIGITSPSPTISAMTLCTTSISAERQAPFRGHTVPRQFRPLIVANLRGGVHQ